MDETPETIKKVQALLTRGKSRWIILGVVLALLIGYLIFFKGGGTPFLYTQF